MSGYCDSEFPALFLFPSPDTHKQQVESITLYSFPI